MWKKAVTALAIVLVSLALQAQTSPVIGVVLMTSGGAVEIRGRNGDVRQAARKMEIHEADTLLVACGSSLQVRMIDDARISLGGDTEFQFNSYRFDPDPPKRDEAIMSLARGGMRTIKGHIGDDQGDEYRIDTPYASANSRDNNTGTFGMLIDNGVLYVDVSTQGLVVANDKGQLDLGTNTSYDFARVERDIAPEGLPDAPPALSSSRCIGFPPSTGA